jgi:hypothetical protein
MYKALITVFFLEKLRETAWKVVKFSFYEKAFLKNQFFFCRLTKITILPIRL